MTLVSDLKNIDGLFTTTLLVLFLSVIAPGVLIIFQFLPDLFIKLDGLKFIIFSASLSLPLFIFNSIFVSLVIDSDEDDGYQFQQVGVLSGILSSAVLYICLIASHVVCFDFVKFLGTVAFIEFCWVAFCLILFFKENKSNKHS